MIMEEALIHTGFEAPTITEYGTVDGLTRGGGNTQVGDGVWETDPNDPNHELEKGTPSS
jgi:hypothetical protein